MLGHDEQRAWEEIRRRYAVETEEPARPVLDLTVSRPCPPTSVGLLAEVVVGGCIALLLVICGAPVAGLAIAVATAPRWLLWRYWPLLDGGVGRSAPTAIRHVPVDGEDHPSSEEFRRNTPRPG